VISAGTRPHLAAKARLRWDRKAERWMLLYPERGLVLNPTGADVVQLCTGEHTVETIVEKLAEKYTTQPREALEQEIVTFLGRLAERGLVSDHGE
jgi:pyrroloquinoline quinone biosynthesis protein D